MKNYLVMAINSIGRHCRFKFFCGSKEAAVKTVEGFGGYSDIVAFDWEIQRIMYETPKWFNLF